MNISTISSKYQVVIPKELRRLLQLKPGQKVSFTLTKNKSITISPEDPLRELQDKFSGRNIWGADPAVTIRKMRDEWDD